MPGEGLLGEELSSTLAATGIAMRVIYTGLGLFISRGEIRC